MLSKGLGLFVVALVLAACTGGSDDPIVLTVPSSLSAPTENPSEPAEPEQSSESTSTSTTASSTTSSTAPSLDPSSSTTGEAAGSSTSASSPPGSSTTAAAPSAPAGPETLVGSFRIEVVATHPHDDTAYTQGLEVYGGVLLESTGRRGVSERRQINTTDWQVVGVVALPADLFGEGLTVANGLIYQLTFTSGVVLVSDPDDLSLQNELAIERDGWGICFDGTHLITSDGTSDLVFRDPTTLDPVQIRTVTLNGDPVRNINELECVGSQVLANIWGLDQIIAIDIATGNVDAVINASGLRPSDLPITDLNFAFNGIAHIPDTDRFYVTGKWWPVLYEVRFVPDN